MALDPHEAVDQALNALERLRSAVKAQSGRQVTAAETRGLVKATALTWLKSQRPALSGLDHLPVLTQLDAEYGKLLNCTDRATSRGKYLDLFLSLKKSLTSLRSPAARLSVAPSALPGIEPPPSFAALVPDLAMQAVLQRRWIEAQLCKGAGAHLAATVMMGSLLEALLLARVNALSDKAPLFKATSAPKDKTGKPLALRDWKLKDYIDVGHELSWIRRSGRDVGAILRDYRNYVHPAKEFAHNMVLEASDAEMFWAICKELTKQLL